MPVQERDRIAEAKRLAVTATAAAAAGSGVGPIIAAVVAIVGVLVLGAVLVVTMAGGLSAQKAATESAEEGVAGPSREALADIPANYLREYLAAGKRYRIDWAILAGIGSIETNHGRLKAQGVTEGANFLGCCGGPMQFYFTPGPGKLPAGERNSSTWGQMSVDGDGDGQKVVWDPADAIPSAARYLRSSGAPGDYKQAIFAYNRADWYVADVLERADRYRGALEANPDAAAGGSLGGGGKVDVDDVLDNQRLTFTASQRDDLRSGRIDPKLVDLIGAVGKEHRIVFTALKTDHAPGTNHNPSDGSKGRAFDIGTVDGDICRGQRSKPCGRLAVDLGKLGGDLKVTELIYCFDPDGPKPDGFARSDHCDHIHAGYDAR